MTTAAQPAASSYSEGFFSSPGDVANAATQANLAVANIDRAVSGTTSGAPQTWIDSWDAFKLVWTSFYNSNFAGGHDLAAWLTSDLEGQLEAYQKQISAFAAQANGYGITVAGSVPSVPTGGPLDWLPTGGTVLGVLALTAAIVVLWKVL